MIRVLCSELRGTTQVLQCSASANEPYNSNSRYQQALVCHRTQTSYADAAWNRTQAWQIENTGGVSCCTLQNVVCKCLYGSFLPVTPVI